MSFTDEKILSHIKIRHVWDLLLHPIDIWDSLLFCIPTSLGPAFFLKDVVRLFTENKIPLPFHPVPDPKFGVIFASNNAPSLDFIEGICLIPVLLKSHLDDYVAYVIDGTDDYYIW